MTFLTEYGLFLAKTVTFLLAIGAIVLMVVSSRQPKARKGELVVTDLSNELEQGQFALKSALASKAERKVLEKQQKEEQKKRAKAGDERSRLVRHRFQWQHGCQRGCITARRGERGDRCSAAERRGAAAP